GLSPDRLSLFEGRLVSVADLARGIPLADILERAGLPFLEATGQASPGEESKDHSIYSWGAHFCEVEIDPLLPRVQVTRWVSCFDVGRVLNPKPSRSQVIGGVTMGIGMALMENTVYDPRSGRPVNANLADYVVPVNADVPEVEVEFVEHPDPVINTLGC